MPTPVLYPHVLDTENNTNWRQRFLSYNHSIPTNVLHNNVTLPFGKPDLI